MSRRVRSPYQVRSHGSLSGALIPGGERCLLCCDARSIQRSTPGSTNGERYLSPGSAARWGIPIRGWRLASARSSVGHQPSSLRAEAIPVVSRYHILPHQGQRLYPHGSVTLSPLPQDHPLPDASRELAGIDGGRGLLLLEHILGVLVEMERLLSPLLLHQQDHQAAQGIFVGRILLQRGEEQLLGQAHPLVLEVEVDQLEEHAVPCAVNRAPPALRPFSVQVVLEKLAPGEGMRLL